MDFVFRPVFWGYCTDRTDEEACLRYEVLGEAKREYLYAHQNLTKLMADG